MSWKQCLLGSVGLALLWLLAPIPAAQAGGTQITAVTEPLANWVVTVQWIIGIIGTLILMIVALTSYRSEAVGLVGIVIAIVCLIVAFKAPDIVASFGPQRAIAATLVPVVISAGQQVLDAGVTWVVHTGWVLVGAVAVRHGRRACGL
jgi:hypothetical protein